MITSSVNGVSEEIKNSLKTLADTHKEQLEFEQKSFEESTEKFKSTIKEMIEQVDAIPSELNELYTELAKIPEEVKTINERLDTSSLNETIDRIQELSRSMKEGEATLVSLMNNSGDSFKEAVVELSETANEFEKITESMKKAEKKFESSNTAMSLHIDKLLEYDKEISVSLERIADKLNPSTEDAN